MDPNDLAAFGAGELSEASREALEAELAAASPQDRATVAALAAEAARRPEKSAPRWVPLVAAAALVAAIGVVWWMGRARGPAPWDDKALSHAFASLGKTHPDAFEGITPLLRPEREETPSAMRNGGLRVTAPSGSLLATPQAVRWETLDGAATYHVDVISDEGVELFRTEGTPPSAWPGEAELVPGATYVATVRTTVGGVRAQGASSFRLLSEQEVQAYRVALAAIGRDAPAPLRAVMCSHLAIRRELWHEARKHLEAAGPEDAPALVTQTRTYLDRHVPRP